MDSRRNAPTLAGLVTILGSQLAPTDVTPVPARELSGVHVSELLDPTPYLAGGELLLTTGLSLRDGFADIDRYVADLIRSDVAALGLGLGPVFLEPPAALAHACRRAGLPLLVVPAPTPFLAITRAYWSAVARSGEERLLNELATQRLLVDAAASADPVPSVLKALARAVDGWAAISGRGGRIAHVHPIAREDDAHVAQSAVGRLGDDRSAGAVVTTSGRVSVFPFPEQAGASGSALFVGTERPLQASSRRTALTAFAMLTLSQTGEDVTRARDLAVADDVAALIDLGMAEAASALAAEHARPIPPARGTLLIFRSRDVHDLVGEVRRSWPDADGRARDDDTAWFFLHPAQVASADVVSALQRMSPTLAWLAVDDVRVERVREALDAARTLKDPARVGGPSGAPSIPAQVRRALEDLRAHPELVATVTAYLRHRGGWERAAEELGVHRNTVRNRVTAIRQAVALDLDDPDIAAHAWLELRGESATR